MSEEETFMRLFYWGTVQLGFSSDEVWLMRIGLLLDLIACHRQFLGIDKPAPTIDDIIPF